MTTIDERGRAAASELRRSMEQGFDVEAGLASVLREETVVKLAAAALRPRRTWMVLSAAAAVAVVGMIGVLALRSPEQVDVGDVPPATSLPAVPVPTTSASDTTDALDEVAVETTLVPETATAVTAAAVEQTVRVADVVQVVEAQRTVLVSGAFGDGSGELGIENCRECDPARPWAPLRIPFGPRGKVLVADAANRRWMLFEPEDPSIPTSPWSSSTIPWPDGVGVSSQPVADQAGTVYVVMYGPLGDGGVDTFELWVLDPGESLTEPIGRYPAPSIGNTPITLNPRSVAVGGVIADGLVPAMSDAPDVGATPADISAGTAARFTVRWEQFRTTFEYEPGEAVSAYGPNASLPDLTVLTQQFTPTGEIVDRLFLDGTVARLSLPPSASAQASAFATEDGFLRLEAAADGAGWEIVRYALPALD